jgi:Ca2+-binding EF-hand superfamily protein
MAAMGMQPRGRPDPEAMFKKIDVNEDGALDNEEISAFETKMQERTGKVDNNKPSLMDFDSDEDGLISKDEFLAGSEKMRPQGPPPGPPPGDGAGKSQDLAALIEALSGKSDSDETDPLDTNKDGTVDADEMQAALGNFVKNVMKAYTQAANYGSQAAASGASETSVSIEA